MRNFISIFITLLVMSCENVSILGPGKVEEIYITKVPGKDYAIRVVHIPSNATIQSSIQVRKKIGNNKEEIIANYDRYNFVDTCRLINDTSLMLVIRDTISILGNKPDTMMITLK